MSPGSPLKTPKTPGSHLNQPNGNSYTPSHHSNLYRLLYRGALSLPDSHLVLDGLTFIVKLESPSKHVTSSLLDNPLALALESMRGRPSLRFLGVIKLADVYMDDSGSVEMDIHPRAMLSRIYFENIFCLNPFPNNGKAASLKSDIGIKVALGDSDGPETTQIAVYAQVKSCDEPSQDKTPTIQLRVGRLTLRPPQKPVRLPRPDDPIPRKPPIAFGRVDSRGTLKPGELKRAASGTLALNGGVKRPKLVGGGSVSNLGSGVRLAPTASSSDVFKVPELPKQAVKQAKGNDKEKEDVFGGVSEVGRLQGADAKGKRKADELDDLLELEEEEIDGGALERANKNKIKKATVSYLAQTKDPAKKGMIIDKNHPDFKEFYGAVYRGVCFAVRGRIRLESVDLGIVERLLKLHTKMYLTGLGPPST